MPNDDMHKAFSNTYDRFTDGSSSYTGAPQDKGPRPYDHYSSTSDIAEEYDLGPLVDKIMGVSSSQSSQQAASAPQSAQPVSSSPDPVAQKATSELHASYDSASGMRASDYDRRNYKSRNPEGGEDVENAGNAAGVNAASGNTPNNKNRKKKNRPNNKNNASSNNRNNRNGNPMSAEDIPEFEYDVEDPEGVDASSEAYVNGPAMGVNSSMGNAPVNFGTADAITRENPTGSEDPLTMPPFEFEEGMVSLPNPEVFNSYPPEVQRKIMEWTDRDLRARRDDESRRQDAILRANIARDRMRMTVPVAIVILCIVCAAVTGLMTKNPIFVVSFLAVAVVVIIAAYFMKRDKGKTPYPPYSNRP